MTQLARLCLLGQVLLFLRCDGDEPPPTVTVNQCQLDTLPSAVTSSLKDAAHKVLIDWNPGQDTMMIMKINENLLLLNETMFVEDDNTNEKKSALEFLLSNQKNDGLMLNTILNSNLNLLGSLNLLEESGTKTYELVFSSMKEQRIATEVLNNMTKQLDDMHNLMERNMTEATTQQEKSSRTSREVERKSLNLQLETNHLVKSLVVGRQEDSFIKEKFDHMESEIQGLNLEIKKLQRKIKKDNSRPADCHELFISGVKQSGVYEIYPYRCHCSKPIQVWCDMKEDGGGWTVLMNRRKLPVPVNFTRSWNDYEEGFGDRTGEYWIGNEHLHALTSNRHYTLRINMQNRSGKKRWGQWNEFTVSSAQDNYELDVGGFSPFSTISKDILRTHSKQPFSTYDKDNDASYDKNCAGKYKGGWWYGRCFDINPTGILLAPDRKTSVVTSYFYYGKKRLIPLKRITMKVKPRSCVPHTLEDDTQHLATTCKLP